MIRGRRRWPGCRRLGEGRQASGRRLSWRTRGGEDGGGHGKGGLSQADALPSLASDCSAQHPPGRRPLVSPGTVAWKGAVTPAGFCRGLGHPTPARARRPPRHTSGA